MRPRGARGLTLIELMAATALLGLMCLAVLQVLIGAQRWLRASQAHSRAVQLAAEIVERVRAGDQVSGSDEVGPFRRKWSCAKVEGTSGILRVDVRIEWQDVAPHTYALAAYVPEAP